MSRVSNWASLLLAAAGFAAAQGPAFEVVSVKPAPPDAKLSQTTYDPSSVTAYGVNLKQLIEWAYGVTDVQVSGGPGWKDFRFFDVVAKAEGMHSKEQLLRMLQPVLAERFKLALHRETKEMTVQVLTAGGNSPDLHPAQGGPANIKLQFKATDGSDSVIEITGQSVSPRFLADYLTGIFGSLVMDRTGMPGSFDFTVDVPVDQNRIVADKRSATTGVLMDAMLKLGLRLGSKKESVEMIVIDHAEPPSEN